MKWYDMKNQANDTAEIIIYDQVGSEEMNAKTFHNDLKSLGTVQTLNLHINSPGGSVFDGFAIYNQLKRHQATVNVFIDGVAASIASIIAMAGDRIVMPSNTYLMIHDPSGLVWGSAKDMKRMAGTMEKVKDGLITAYQDRTGLPRARISTLMDEETWFTASETVELNFADEEIREVKMAAHYDLSSYQNIPKQLNSFTNVDSELDPAEFGGIKNMQAYQKAAKQGKVRMHGGGTIKASFPTTKL